MPKVVDDCENMDDEDEIPGCASDDPTGRMDRTQLTGSDPHVSRTELYQNNDLLYRGTRSSTRALT